MVAEQRWDGVPIEGCEPVHQGNKNEWTLSAGSSSPLLLRFASKYVMSSRPGRNPASAAFMPAWYMSCPSDQTMTGILSGWPIAAATPM